MKPKLLHSVQSILVAENDMGLTMMLLTDLRNRGDAPSSLSSRKDGKGRRCKCDV
jgi:hypothetical protein